MTLGVDIWPCLVEWVFSALVSAALSGSQGNAATVFLWYGVLLGAGGGQRGIEGLGNKRGTGASGKH